MGEKSEFAAKSSIAALQERALDLIASRPEGLYQSDLRRLLEIDSSKCSKVVSRLQGSGLICRENVPASSTYLLKVCSEPSSSHLTSTTPATSISVAASTSSANDNSPVTDISPVTNISPVTDISPPVARSSPPALACSKGKEGGSEKIKGAAEDLNGGIDYPVHDGRIKMMIDRQIEILLDRRICSQVNSRSCSPIDNIENIIDSIYNSSPDGKRSIPVESEEESPTDNREPDHSPGSYFDCYRGDDPNNQSNENLDIEGRIGGRFDHRRSFGHHNNIDSYLTEIYLLYLTRATSF